MWRPHAGVCGAPPKCACGRVVRTSVYGHATQAGLPSHHLLFTPPLTIPRTLNRCLPPFTCPFIPPAPHSCAPPGQDENFALHHDAEGILSMANNGPNTSTSQFQIVMGSFDFLDGKVGLVVVARAGRWAVMARVGRAMMARQGGWR